MPLVRRLNLFHASALNMINMIGIGPFITIPLLMSAMNGPAAMLGWGVALIIALCDGLVWSELGAAMPASGGSFGYLREAFGRHTFGRLMAFLFVWQFILSGPLEIASGYIGFSKYTTYIWPALRGWHLWAIAAAVGVINIAFLYRRIGMIGAVSIALWVGTIAATLAVIVTGAMHFSPRVAFDFPAGSFDFSIGFVMGLGAASRIGIYDYLGYYDVCYIGDEVKNPGRVIPRSILISTVAVAKIGTTSETIPISRYDCRCVSPQIAKSVMTAPLCGSVSSPPADMAATRCISSRLTPSSTARSR
jgi:amino acid transporter